MTDKLCCQKKNESRYECAQDADQSHLNQHTDARESIWDGKGIETYIRRGGNLKSMKA